ncbi:MAG: ABC transporter permease, partial [Pseudomonadota bacterium]
MQDARFDTKTLGLSLLAMLALWWVAAWLGDDPGVLPSPAEVWRIFLGEMADGEMQLHFTATLLRVTAAFSLAMGFGCLIGFVMGVNATINRWFSAWLVVLLNVPALVVIVLCYLWIGLNEVA